MEVFYKAFSIAVSGSLLTFIVTFIMGYLHLLGLQPPHDLLHPMPQDVTAFPPSAAWLFALPCSLAALVLLFAAALIMFNCQNTENAQKQQ